MWDVLKNNFEVPVYWRSKFRVVSINPHVSALWGLMGHNCFLLLCVRPKKPHSGLRSALASFGGGLQRNLLSALSGSKWLRLGLAPRSRGDAAKAACRATREAERAVPMHSSFRWKTVETIILAMGTLAPWIYICIRS